MALLFDLECNGLNPDKVHCLVIKDTQSGVVRTYIGDAITDGVFYLSCQNVENQVELIAHNGIKFDIPVLEKLYPFFMYDKSRIIDTLVLSRLIYADLSTLDEKFLARKIIEGKEYKSHSLAAWGKRLGIHKGNYTGDWETYSQEMLDYCIQDVEVLHALYTKLSSQGFSQRSIDLEHKVAFICAKQERHGFLFDFNKATQLHATLVGHKAKLEDELKVAFPPLPMNDGKPVIYKRDNPSKGITAGVPYQKQKVKEFNPGSRDHITHWLKHKYQWVPKEHTNDGKAKVDETVLNSLPYPEAKLMAEYLMVTKRLGQLAEGEQAWMKAVDHENRLHGGVICNGAVTGRATHAHPNVAQVPANRAPYGADCRTLFCVPEEKALVGADLSGLELRCLAHYMGKWDGGAYGRVLLEGDIHTANQHAAGLSTRDQAKTFIYAFLYGAGSAKLGSIVGKGAGAGAKLKSNFLKKVPGLTELVEAVTKAADKGYLIGLDGRKVTVRSPHAALNTLLQSAGALIAKQALVEFDSLVSTKGWTMRVQQVAWVHDEVQIECDKEIADEVGQMAVRAFQLAGEAFGFRVPITGEYRVGRNWAETH